MMLYYSCDENGSLQSFSPQLLGEDMPIIVQLVFCSLVGGVFSLIGGVLLTINRRAHNFAGYATAFAAGALLAAAFVDLLPEAMEQAEPTLTLIFTMIGLIVFFFLEAGLNWFHSHAHEDEDGHDHDHSSEYNEEASATGATEAANRVEPIIPMIILGGTLHHIIDGVAIAAGFLISPTSGIVVTLAIAAHEIPHRLGDFGIMLHNGLSKTKTIVINLATAMSATVSAVVFYLLGNLAEGIMAPLLGVVAGFFIYIAATDIIPTIHKERNRLMVLKKSLWLIGGVVVVSAAILVLHGMVVGLGIE
jgi:zinc and cadmium transporter